jgi:hypothetical protein
MVIKLVIAVLSATLAPFLVCLLTLPLAMGLVALSFYGTPGILKDLTGAAGMTSYLIDYFGIGMTLCMGVQFVILGIPTAILGWRFGRITLLSSIIAGFIIGCLPSLLILPFDQSYDLNYTSMSTVILRDAEIILGMGVLGAVEGILFWLVWWFLSRRSVPKKNAPGLG